METPPPAAFTIVSIDEARVLFFRSGKGWTPALFATNDVAEQYLGAGLKTADGVPLSLEFWEIVPLDHDQALRVQASATDSLSWPKVSGGARS